MSEVIDIKKLLLSISYDQGYEAAQKGEADISGHASLRYKGGFSESECLEYGRGYADAVKEITTGRAS